MDQELIGLVNELEHLQQSRYDYEFSLENKEHECAVLGGELDMPQIVVVCNNFLDVKI